MSWVTINQEECNSCGLCALRCARCFTNTDGKVTVEADITNCNLCGHCISLCPTSAIIHNKMDMDNFIDVAKSVPVSSRDFMQLVKRRRSHRSFKKKNIERADLEMLIEACRYSPTGSNVQSVEIIVVQDPDRIKKLSNLNVDYFDTAIKEAEEQAEKMKAEGREFPEDFKYTLATLQSRKTLVEARDLGIDTIFHRAPAVMIFHSVAPTSTPKDNCVIAAQTVTLAAMTLGLETCYIGLFEAAANTYPPLVEELALPPDNQVLSVLILGHPRMKYLRTVDRKPLRVSWE